MRKVVLDRHDLRVLQVETQLLQAPGDALPVAVEAPVAGDERVERAIRGIPVAPGVVPARRFGEADRCKGNGYRVNVGRLDAGKFQAELRRFVRHAVLGVLVANEALLLSRRDELAVDVERCRRVVGQRAGQSE